MWFGVFVGLARGQVIVNDTGLDRIRIKTKIRRIPFREVGIMAKAKKRTARGKVASKSRTASKSKAKTVKAKSKATVKPKAPARPKAAAAKAKTKPAGAAAEQAPKRAIGVPVGYNHVQAQLVQEDCAAALDFYHRAFGAQEIMRMPGSNGKIMHAEIRLGDSVVFMADAFEQMPDYKPPRSVGAVTGSIYMYVSDVDVVHRAALRAGATESMAPTDMFWGDRMSLVVDPWGHRWTLATRVKEMTEEEMRAAMPSGM